MTLSIAMPYGQSTVPRSPSLLSPIASAAASFTWRFSKLSTTLGEEGVIVFSLTVRRVAALTQEEYHGQKLASTCELLWNRVGNRAIRCRHAKKIVEKNFKPVRAQLQTRPNV